MKMDDSNGRALGPEGGAANRRELFPGLET